MTKRYLLCREQSIC